MKKVLEQLVRFQTGTEHTEGMRCVRKKPDETGARLETPPRKSLLLLSYQTDVFESPAITAT